MKHGGGIRMNKKQVVISIIGVAIVFLMGIIPPWKIVDTSSMTYREMPAGYYFIFAPPEPDEEELLGVKLDLSRLAVQWVTILFVIAAALFLTQEKEEESNSMDNTAEFLGD
jgi:hypothetical protein